MNANQNKQLLQAAFSEMEKGNTRPFVDLMAEDFCWTAIGTTPWSGTWRGKEVVRRDFFAPLFAQFADQYSNTALRFIADGDYVAVECRGRVTTKSGKPYHNTYCYVCRMEGGRLRELTEYFDTVLVQDALQGPGAAAH